MIPPFQLKFYHKKMQLQKTEHLLKACEIISLYKTIFTLHKNHIAYLLCLYLCKFR